MPEDVNIRKAVLHVLDSNLAVPVFSCTELEPEGEAFEFLEKHISRMLGDHNLKGARFHSEGSPVAGWVRRLAGDPEFFLQASIEMADRLFAILCKNADIPSADLVCCLFAYDSAMYFGILKMNYKTGYTHHVEQTEEGVTNAIIRHRTLLPLESQKIEEGALICLDGLEIRLLEKAFEVDGEKQFYFSSLFLECSTALSSNEKVKIIEKAAQKINKKFFDEDFDKAVKMKKEISECLEEHNLIRVEEIAEEVFQAPEIRNEYFSEIHKAGLTEKAVPVPEKLVEKKFTTHKIRTDTGIEINFPLSCYNDADKIEFVNHPDGTISIVIKNVGRIVNG